MFVQLYTYRHKLAVVLQSFFLQNFSQQSSEMQICTVRIISLLESFIGFPPPEFQTPVSLDE